MLSELYGNAYCVNANIRAFARAACDFIPISDCREPEPLEELGDFYEMLFGIETTAVLIVELGKDMVSTLFERELAKDLLECELLEEHGIQEHRMLYALDSAEKQALLHSLRECFAGTMFPEHLVDSTHKAFLCLHSNTTDYCGLAHTVLGSDNLGHDYAKRLLINAYEEMAKRCDTPDVRDWISR